MRIALFGRPARPASPPERPVNRRVETRYDARRDRVRLVWLPDRGPLREVRGFLLNVSLVGAAVAVYEDVPRDRSVWLSLDDDPDDPIEATVMALERGTSGHHTARLAFDSPGSPRFLARTTGVVLT